MLIERMTQESQVQVGSGGEALLDAPPHRIVPQTSLAQATVLDAMGDRCIVLVGMMGAGKTSLGRRLAARMGLAFVDADAEIEAAAAMSIPEIFARHGEAHFREGERRVLGRLLTGGPKVIATGGGSFIDEQTRRCIVGRGISVWLKADFETLMRRVRKRSNRPLLHTADPEATLRRLMLERYPVYALADVTVQARDMPHETVVDQVVTALADRLSAPAMPSPFHAGQNAAISSPPGARVVTVDLAERSYSIVIGAGLLASMGKRVAALAPGCACAIVTDDNVANHHLAPLQASLDAVGIRHSSVVLPHGERAKSFRCYQDVCDAIIAAKCERRDIVLALGGGVVGDLAGFAAATVRRGMRVVQVPTSLLAQVDSSVGGKTGINSGHGKNLIGAFHQPSLVLADTKTLDTLPQREFRAGYAEVVKYGLTGDYTFFAWLEENWREVFAGGSAREEAIASSCAAKAAVVMRDETETGERALLNLGHTFGHALERLTHYDGTRLVHGEAVAIGMVCAFRFSQQLGLCSDADAVRVETHLAAVGLPTRMRQVQGFSASSAEVIDAMAQDKKVERGRLTFILARSIGAGFIAKDIDGESLARFLRAELAGI